jgi:C1A family cysteine protease
LSFVPLRFATMAPVLKGGWIPDSYDANDQPYRPGANVEIKKSVDLRAVYKNAKWDVYQQYRSGSCAANATAAALRFLATRLNDKPSEDQELTDPSRLFIYWNARMLPEVKDNKWPTEFVPKDTGCLNRDALKGLNKFGVCAEHTWPFKPTDDSVQDFPDKPNRWEVQKINDPPGDPNLKDSETYKEASGHKIYEYCRLDPDLPAPVQKQLSLPEKQAVGVVTLMKLRICLSEGYPVVLGLYWDGNPKSTDWHTRSNKWSMPDRKEWNAKMISYTGDDGVDRVAGHAVLAIGYDNDTGLVLCMNSWGKAWGEEGCFWMSFDYIKDWEATNDFWMLRLTEAAKIQQAKPTSG